MQYVFGYAVVTLEEVAAYSLDRCKAKSVNADTYVGVDNLLSDKRGKVASSYVPSEGNLTKYLPGDILIGNIRPYLKKIWLADNEGGTNGDVLTIRAKDSSSVSYAYLYYVLSSEAFFAYAAANSKGGKMPRGDKKAVMRYSFCLPPLEKQKEIAALLDRFDALCSDISRGLPAEIEARRKQYEYYRDKLLSFPRADLE